MSHVTILVGTQDVLCLLGTSGNLVLLLLTSSHCVQPFLHARQASEVSDLIKTQGLSFPRGGRWVRIYN